MAVMISRWLTARPNRWAHLRQVPLRQLSIMLLGVFLLFTTTGFYVDLMAGGVLAYVVVLVNAAFGGANAVLWILVLARLPRYWLLAMVALQVFFSIFQSELVTWVAVLTHVGHVPGRTGIHFAATSTLVAVISSYCCFVAYIRVVGKEAYRYKAELELAQSIQKTLVPPIAKRTRCFEIYGISEPSEKVGGDLVDVVELQGGDVVAYLADIAGHGLQAGILMGMLKTAAHTALLEEPCGEGGAALSMLMERLNQVLPGVKEPHMYATFTGLRLDADGQSFYGMAASPPLLHWDAARRTIARVEEKQFPLGLLPVKGFSACPLGMAVGDLVVIATDGVLEVSAEHGKAQAAEFGDTALEQLLLAHAEKPLAELASLILEKVRTYGKQFDDQTLLLVRHLAS